MFEYCKKAIGQGVGYMLGWFIAAHIAVALIALMFKTIPLTWTFIRGLK